MAQWIMPPKVMPTFHTEMPVPVLFAMLLTELPGNAPRKTDPNTFTGDPGGVLPPWLRPRLAPAAVVI